MIGSNEIRKSILLAGILTWVVVPMAKADSFIDDHSDLRSSFAAFNNSLDTMGARMRKDYDFSNLSNSHRNLVDAQTNQTDTWRVSQDMFNRDMTDMVLSGGSYNSNGSYGFTGWGIGNYSNNGNNNQVSPDNWGTSGGSSIGGNSSFNGSW